MTSPVEHTPVSPEQAALAGQRLLRAIDGLYVPHRLTTERGYHLPRARTPRRDIRGLDNTGSEGDPSLRITARDGSCLFSTGGFTCFLKPVQRGLYNALTSETIYSADGAADTHVLSVFSSLAISNPAGQLPVQVHEFFSRGDQTPTAQGTLGPENYDPRAVELANQLAREIDIFAARKAVGAAVVDAFKSFRPPEQDPLHSV